MHIVALAWIYVVSMMAITEKSVVAGVMTFLMYCAIPLGLLWFLLRRSRRVRMATPKHQLPDDRPQEHDSNKSGTN